ncbi:LPS-assembly protein LptD [Luteimonas wenzhouensis]|uniref:LPS-assembly protein LptD n=1 Tax=Luteimonas wenzhouensis TaxID=2599615 RepID=A0A5C5U7P9_9GAMM|nr:LPS-assembly protein LptD [Luteimonas wenzhouensis]TWT21966.1 LPS-assembly protein LptD [Luteimonas wenzhouensis]
MRPTFRLLPLPICIALSLAAHADDDMPVDWSMCPLEDAVPLFPDAQPPVGDIADRDSLPTDIQGDQTVGVDGGIFNVTGNVTLRRGDQFLGTDSIEYSQETGTYTATGNVRYQDSGMRVVAERLEGDQNNDSHRIDNVRYQLTERRGNGGAERIEMQDSRGRMFESTYSTCPPSQRWWELRAHRIDVDTDEGTGVARSATLRIGKVPVLYVPWLAFPIDDRRRTGLLYPNIGLSSRNGFDYAQPVYFNLAPNYDLTLEPRWMSRRGLQLGTEFRYLYRGGRGTLDLQLLPSDDLTWREREREIVDVPIGENRREDDRGMFRYSGYHRFNRNWNARARVYWLSDPRWIEDASSSVEGASVSSLRSTVGLHGRGRYWNALIEGDYRHLADYTIAESRLPYNRLPRAYFGWEQPFGRWLVAGLDTEAARFTHIANETLADGSQTRPGGSRLLAKPWVSMPVEGASWFVRPTLAFRHVQYRLDDALARNLAPASGAPDDSPSASHPIASLDAGLFFDRNTRFRGGEYLHTLEPRVFYLNAPYRDQDHMPRFDTRPMTFSWGQLFRDNRYSGGDRQGDANQLTTALTTRLIRESDGREKLSASIGQIRYFEDARVTLDNEAPIRKGESAWVVDANYAINDRWTVGASYQWNPATRREDLATIRTRYLVGDEGIVNFAYRYRRNVLRQTDLLEQVDLSFLYPINPSWSVVGRYYYSLQHNQVLEGIAGVQWESCCVAARLVARRYLRNTRGEMNDSIQLEIELKGLGSAGPDNRGRLRRAILGYHRDDLYLVPPSELQSSVDDDPPADDFLP